MHAHPEILGKAGLAEWDHATKGKKLPEHKMKHEKKHSYSHTTIHHHTDGSHTMKHHHESDPTQDMSSAKPDLAGVQSQLESVLGRAGAGAPAGEAAPAAPAQQE